jgi:hypothetical protein
MATVINQQSAENMAYVRRLLKEKQPGFAAALELALAVTELELWPPQMPAETSATKAHQRFCRVSGVRGGDRRLPGCSDQ